VDPELEMVDAMLDFVFEHGLKVAYVVDTHTHADHFSGAREVKAKTIAKLVMHREAPAGCVDVRVEDGDRLYLGDLPVKFLHTPGARQGPRLRAAARQDTLGRRATHRVLRPDRPAQRQRGQGVPHALPHLQGAAGRLLVFPGHDYEGREHSVSETRRRRTRR
jgi:glyoxylase-like metal-dependent hydrolase (beta-lactamase superfamily II)